MKARGNIAVLMGVLAVGLMAAVLAWGPSLSWPLAAAGGMAGGGLVAAMALRRRSSRTGAPESEPRIAALEAEVADLSQRCAELDKRVELLDQALVQYSRTTVRAVASELDRVGSVVRDLAEAVALHDAELFAPQRTADPPSPPPAAPQGEAEPSRPPAPLRREVGSGRLDGAAGEQVLTAILAERLDVVLQPVLTLPRQRVAFYEVQVNAPVPATMAQIAELAQDRGVSRRLDGFVFGHAARIARHLLSRGRDVQVLCALTPRALQDPTMFQVLAALAQSQRDVVSRIVLQLPQAAVQRLAPFDAEALHAIRDLGFAFALSDPHDLRLDPRALAAQGFRCVKASAPRLLAAAQGAVSADIHPADLAGLLARSGLTMIVDGIDTDETLAELADFAIPLAQGALFGAPRPVRLDILDEPPAPPAPEHAPPPAPPARTQPAADAAPRRSLRSVVRRSSA